MEKLDILVIGAGVVGLAIAREFALAGREVIVIDREKIAGSVTSARNSGVIHAGIYYPAGSNKAKHCVAGKQLLYAYAKSQHIPFNHCGKIISASNAEELEKLTSMIARAKANGVHDLRLITAEEARELEPELHTVGAIYSPSTGIVDIHALMDSFQAEIIGNRGYVALGNGFASGVITDDGIEITTEDGTSVRANCVINAAGIAAQSVARVIDGMPHETIPALHLAKGNYFSVTGEKPFSRLVYPVPEPGGLGAHFTMNIAGESLFGPDVEWLDETADATQPARLNYDVDAARMERFYASIRRYWPGVDSRSLQPAYSGIRPKLAAKGEPDGDFTIHGAETHGVKGLVHLYGIESPGLTSAMSLAKAVREMLH